MFARPGMAISLSSVAFLLLLVLHWKPNGGEVPAGAASSSTAGRESENHRACQDGNRRPSLPGDNADGG